ncbi:NAD-dependent epimerase [Mycobacterium sp. GA-1841]|uniref:NAD(P)H-binding protein n=1 Tax=Mycobacterium sp. GA-1841 TaxID=1834154 RepID=UPI00096FC810|nr:NAD(P)H-binding protein [Mycobacterium sp. GA-1841]OMC29972.1 NAD-dependent epimerase [Mycobacterium sp. GA-1841]
MRILVTGATGYVGSRLVSALLAEGHHVTVAARDPDKVRGFGWVDDVRCVVMDAGDADSVGRALTAASGRDGVDVLYYLLHGIGEPDFREADNSAAGNVARAAAAAGVSRIVYLGGFVPDARSLSEHLQGRAEVAAALQVPGGAELVWLGAAMIIGAGSTSFEMLRYVADRFVTLPMPNWAGNPIDPISIRDVLYYLVVAADAEQVPAGSYDLAGPERTTYGELMQRYARICRRPRVSLPLPGVPIGLVGRLTAAVLPLPGGLSADLVASLEYPMTTSDRRLSATVADPPGGLVAVDDALARSVAYSVPAPVNVLGDPHRLAKTDPAWAGGDALWLRRLAGAVTPRPARRVLGVLAAIPRPVVGAVRTGLGVLSALKPGMHAS